MLNQIDQAKVDSLIYLFRKEIKVIFAMDDRLKRRGKLSRKMRKRVYDHHGIYSLRWVDRMIAAFGIRIDDPDPFEEPLPGPQSIDKTIDILLFRTELAYVDPKRKVPWNVQKARERLVEQAVELIQAYPEQPLATGDNLRAQVDDALR
ncbi:MAG: hypothetical protein LKF36_03630 [Lactobacillus sp.]|jgi:hypothetical protein|nr:hypothetical protein [Lactobacillus sp.]